MPTKVALIAPMPPPTPPPPSSTSQPSTQSRTTNATTFTFSPETEARLESLNHWTSFKRLYNPSSPLLQPSALLHLLSTLQPLPSSFYDREFTAHAGILPIVGQDLAVMCELTLLLAFEPGEQVALTYILRAEGLTVFFARGSNMVTRKEEGVYIRDLVGILKGIAKGEVEEDKGGGLMLEMVCRSCWKGVVQRVKDLGELERDKRNERVDYTPGEEWDEELRWEDDECVNAVPEDLLEIDGRTRMMRLLETMRRLPERPSPQRLARLVLLCSDVLVEKEEEGKEVFLSERQVKAMERVAQFWHAIEFLTNRAAHPKWRNMMRKLKIIEVTQYLCPKDGIRYVGTFEGPRVPKLCPWGPQSVPSPPPSSPTPTKSPEITILATLNAIESKIYPSSPPVITPQIIKRLYPSCSDPAAQWHYAGDTTVRIHAETTLATFLAHQLRSKTISISYLCIGTSNRCCWACDAWLEDVHSWINELSKSGEPGLPYSEELYRRGCSGVVFGGNEWRIPRDVFEEIDDAFGEGVRQAAMEVVREIRESMERDMKNKEKKEEEKKKMKKMGAYC